MVGGHGQAGFQQGGTDTSCPKGKYFLEMSRANGQTEIAVSLNARLELRLTVRHKKSEAY